MDRGNGRPTVHRRSQLHSGLFLAKPVLTAEVPPALCWVGVMVVVVQYVLLHAPCCGSRI